MIPSPSDTIAAIATPHGEGGIGVIRLSGTRAIAIAGRLFRSPANVDLAHVASHTCHLGDIIDPRGSSGAIDQAIVTIFRDPHSYTGEDVVEISGHGSPRILERILSACLGQDARLAGPGEFTLRAFLSGRIDLTQAEAVADLIRSRTDKTQAAALAQLEGSLAREIRGMREALLPLLAHIEVGLDHSDDDHDFLRRDELASGCRSVAARMETILTSARVSKILRDGFRVALVGRPNVGKSSLLNALLKEDRAIVTPIAGTTRDTLEERLHWDGMPVVLTDTAGLRAASQDPVEQIGMDRSRQALEQSDVALGLFDGSEPLNADDRHVIELCAAKAHVWVVNKSDLPAGWPPAALSALNGGGPVVSVSARTGDGLDDLMRTAQSLALSETAPAGEARWLLNARHGRALEQARDALHRAADAAAENRFEECVALDLRAALNSLGDIIGETATEDLLGEIFSRFCVGK
ncbi:MAG TPA: tRNA uridine-5-carboxymethylaminomethyl(34) synthesis GTPase MnmE [Elusimicrobiota bacterium]|nr:tRNA uridine-5-carboxymethylaminomethyl(34) synthesis GTPase MnmE [Elusimicrobiota bacterium]